MFCHELLQCSPVLHELIHGEHDNAFLTAPLRHEAKNARKSLANGQ